MRDRYRSPAATAETHARHGCQLGRDCHRETATVMQGIGPSSVEVATQRQQESPMGHIENRCPRAKYDIRHCTNIDSTKVSIDARLYRTVHWPEIEVAPRKSAFRNQRSCRSASWIWGSAPDSQNKETTDSRSASTSMDKRIQDNIYSR